MDALMIDELATQVESRANVYALLARAYAYEVDAGFSRELARSFVFETADGQLASHMDAMRAALASADEAAIEQLAVTFDRVFFGMGPLATKTAFPYESVYTSPKGLLMQEAFDEMRTCLRAEQLRVDTRFTEPDDHIAVQLSFMGYLCQQAADFLRKGDIEEAERRLNDQLGFLEGHMANWVGRFALELEAAAHDGFYASLARFTKRFIELDKAAVRDTLGLEES